MIEKGIKPQMIGGEIGLLRASWEYKAHHPHEPIRVHHQSPLTHHAHWAFWEAGITRRKLWIGWEGEVFGLRPFHVLKKVILETVTGSCPHDMMDI